MGIKIALLEEIFKAALMILMSIWGELSGRLIGSSLLFWIMKVKVVSQLCWFNKFSYQHANQSIIEFLKTPFFIPKSRMTQQFIFSAID